MRTVNEICEKVPFAKEVMSCAIWCVAFGFSCAWGHEARTANHRAYKAVDYFEEILKRTQPKTPKEEPNEKQ